MRRSARRSPLRLREQLGLRRHRPALRPISGKTWERSEGLGLPEDERRSSSRRPGTSSPGTRPSRGRSGSAASPASSSAPTTRARAGRSNEGVLKHADARQVEPRRRRADHATRSRSTPTTRSGSGSGSRPPVSSAPTTRARAGSRRTRGTEACFFPEDRFPEVGPVRPQAARASGAAGPALAAEPLRRLPLGRPRRQLGAARRQRPSVRVRLRARTRPVRSGPGVRDPGGGRREPRHLRRPARDLHDRGRRRELEPDRRRRSRRGRPSSARA